MADATDVDKFSLLLTVPLFFWLLFNGRRGAAMLLDILFFILGCTLLIYLLYSFGFAILRIDWMILWYVMMMMAMPMVGFFTMSVITAILTAGLSLVICARAVEVVRAEAPVEAAVAD